MAGHGRSYTVLALLLVSMGFGTIVLMKLEGKPFKPMPYSLSSQTRQTQNVGSILSTNQDIKVEDWSQIEVVLASSDKYQGQEDALRNNLSNQYHFVVSNGFFGADGQIFRTRCWSNQSLCKSNYSFDDTRKTIRICVLSSSDCPKGTANQYRRLEELVSTLTNYYDIEKDNVIPAV
ncbi:MAG: N-acetylmuramoyl-L-alanine amidase [Phycisphaerae bacterium]|nr:N-acetylmuramoyl-L-alanine amidase [Phycisphaerae bacterium]